MVWRLAFNEKNSPTILVGDVKRDVGCYVVDDASDNGGPQGCPLAHPKTDKQLGCIEDDGVDATPLLEEGAGYGQDQLGPVPASHDGLPGVLYLHIHTGALSVHTRSLQCSDYNVSARWH